MFRFVDMDCTVSIVIPTYNRRHTLVKVIDSYLCQKYVKEIIFVNDGSTDDTCEYLKGLQNKISEFVWPAINGQNQEDPL